MAYRNSEMKCYTGLPLLNKGKDVIDAGNNNFTVICNSSTKSATLVWISSINHSHPTYKSSSCTRCKG